MQNYTGIYKNSRIVSVDILRGLVMIIMALDHIREFFHSSAALFDPLDLKHTSAPIFLTRWITHFCAPIFTFLAGTSAFLTLQKKGKKELSKFLFTRGLWLVIAEITVVNFGLDFFQVFSVIILQVIFAMGIGMMVLSAFIYLPKSLILFTALLIIVGHNALDNVQVTGNDIPSFIWSILQRPRLFVFGSFNLLVAYPILPWMAILFAGYCFGGLYRHYTPEERKKIFAAIGLTCIIVFVAIRLTNLYGDASHWSHQKSTTFTLLSFINTTKYPPSLLYTLMTLGLAILFLAFAEKPTNKITTVLSVYGRVPMFYYILHLYFIHLAFLIIGLISGFSINQLLTSNILQRTPHYGFRLGIVYIIWISIVALLYPLCKWYGAYKMANKHKWWLSYL